MHERIDRQRAVRTDQERVTVRTGMGDVFGPDTAAGAATVLDHDCSIEALADLVADEAADNVGVAACGERHDQLDRPYRIAGCEQASREHGADGSAGENAEQHAA